jgi:hypothetical protein
VNRVNFINPYPCGRISRRGFVTRAAGGFFGAALGGLFAADGKLKDAHIGPHFEPKAKSVIYLFMCGEPFPTGSIVTTSMPAS